MILVRREMLVRLRRATCGALLTMAASSMATACGFGTKPGPPYDFSRLENIAGPVLSLPSVMVATREQHGTDCHTQGCGRPYLTYTLRSSPPSNCDRVQEFVSAFSAVSERFSVSFPGRCAYAGEVSGHAVAVDGRDTGEDIVGPGGAVDHFTMTIFADKLSVKPDDPSRR